MKSVDMWQQGVYRRVDRKMSLSSQEFEEEMKTLRTLVDALRVFRRRLSAGRFD